MMVERCWLSYFFLLHLPPFPFLPDYPHTYDHNRPVHCPSPRMYILLPRARPYSYVSLFYYYLNLLCYRVLLRS